VPDQGLGDGGYFFRLFLHRQRDRTGRRERGDQYHGGRLVYFADALCREFSGGNLDR
jgi:hypothetical protein